MISFFYANRRLLLFLLLPLLVEGRFAAAQENPAILGGDDLSITAGEIVELPIQLDNAYEAYAIDVLMRFDPNQIEVVDANDKSDGVQVLPGSFPDPEFLAKNIVMNDEGTIHYIITQLNPTPPASGSGTVFTIRLRAKASGDALLRFETVEMASRDGFLLPVTLQNITLSVTGAAVDVTPGPAIVVPTPAATASKPNVQPATATSAPATQVPSGSTPLATSITAQEDAVGVTPSPQPSVAPVETATIVQELSNSGTQDSANQEQTSVASLVVATAGSEAVIENETAAVVPTNVDSDAPAPIGESITARNEAQATAVMISSADGIPTVVIQDGPSQVPAATEDVPAGANRITFFLTAALLILAVAVSGLVILLFRRRPPAS